jgi:uncharacterized membrane protein
MSRRLDIARRRNRRRPPRGTRAGKAAEADKARDMPPTPTALGRRIARGWAFLALATAVPLALLLLRLRLTGKSGHLSLPWDLFLGWFPVLLAVPFHRAFRRPEPRRRVALVLLPLACGWLLFFPNAPYLLTEVIHLDRNNGPSTNPVPGWLQFAAGDGPFRQAPVWLDLMLLTSVAACGALQTLAALGPVHGAVARRLTRRPTVGVVCGLLLLTSFGVAIGRFDRFNSWDVFRKPRTVASRLVARVVHPGDQPGVTTCTLALTALLTAGYFGTREFARQDD